MAIARVRSKLTKTDVLMQHAYLRPYIPETVRMTSHSLYNLLTKYDAVFVKPDLGTHGKGVIKVEKLREGGYQYQLGTRTYRYLQFDELYKGLLKHKRKGTYVAQRGIPLLTHRSRRFDIRVMVQMNPRGRWEATGVIGRLGHPARIVTNYHSGGTPMPFSKLVAGHMTQAEAAALRSRICQLSVTAAQQLQKRYPRLKEVGADIAIDTDLRPWILEVNTLPDPYLFRKLKNKSVFRKIYRYAAAYGRFRQGGTSGRGGRRRKRRSAIR